MIEDMLSHPSKAMIMKQSYINIKSHNKYNKSLYSF